jgi:hypothetical protein
MDADAPVLIPSEESVPADLAVRRYLYSAAGSQVAFSTATMSVAEAAMGLEWQEVALSRAIGAASIMAGSHFAARWLRNRSLSFFQVPEQGYLRGVHDSLLFGLGNAVTSYPTYALAGCSLEENLLVTGATTLAYLVGGWYIGKSMDVAAGIVDEPSSRAAETPIMLAQAADRYGRNPSVQVRLSEIRDTVRTWYEEMTPRKQMVTNILAAVAISSGALTYAATVNQDTALRSKETVLEERLAAPPSALSRLDPQTTFYWPGPAAQK